MSTTAPTRSFRSAPTVSAKHLALATAGVLVVNGVVGAAGGDSVADHSTGAGLVSELSAALAFLLAALALAALASSDDGGRLRGLSRALWVLAPAGLTVAALTMIGVVVTGSEPAEWLFVLSVLPTFIGLVAVAVIGSRGGVWPWWTGVGVAAFLPVMFLSPFNSFVMAGIWVTVGLTVGRGAATRR